MESEWVLKIKNNIEEQKGLLHKRDISFFQVDQLVRIAERLDTFGNECTTCRDYKKILESFSGSLSEYINSTPKMKREFEKQTDPIKKHLKIAHQIFPVYYFTSYYSFLGIVVGIAFGTFAGFLFNHYLNQIAILSICIGMGIGYFLGTKKDWKVRHGNRLL